ncbi:MAG: ATP-binding protein [bacterium]|nr:ATP-binding protein [bacterium]
MEPLKNRLNNMMSGISPGKGGNFGDDFDPDAIGTDAVCPVCGGLGYVRYNLPIEHPDFGKVFPCPRGHGSPDPARQQTLRKLGNLDALADKTFATYRAESDAWTPEEARSVAIAYRAALDFADAPHGWLLFEGGYGCGKTHLAAAIANARLEGGDSVLFVTVPDLLDHLRATYAPYSEEGYDQLFERVRNAGLLILDDLGTENPSAWAQEKLFQLFNHRYTYRRPTVITTNADLDRMDGRIKSRLLDRSLTQHIIIDAPDYRVNTRRERDPIYNALDSYQAMRFETFALDETLRPDDRRNLENAYAVARSYVQEQRGHWLILGGSVGGGKTHLAASIANAWRDVGRDVVFITVPDLLDYLRTAFEPNARTTLDQRFTIVRNAPFLVLDDLGTENATSWAREKLFQMLDYRYLRRLPTVITISKPVEDLDIRVRVRLMDESVCTIRQITVPPYAMRASSKRR